jgi:hypothetical protein
MWYAEELATFKTSVKVGLVLEMRAYHSASPPSDQFERRLWMLVTTSIAQVKVELALQSEQRT